MTRRFGDLPLAWKLLLPAVVLILLGGTGGGLLIARDLSARARATLNQSLLQASLRARSLFQGRELYLLESADLAANLEGMDEAVRELDDAAVEERLLSVAALKKDLSVIVITTQDGVGLTELVRRGAAAPDVGAGTRWQRYEPVRRALRARRSQRAADLVRVGDRTLFAVTSPVCAADPCRPVGVALAGVWLDDAVGDVVTPEENTPGVAVYGLDGRLLASAGSPARSRTDVRVGTEQLIRRTEVADGTEVAVLYAPLDLGGRPEAIVAVTLPTAPALAALRGTGIRLGLVLVGVLAGLVLVVGLVSRRALAQVRPLLASSRSLGRGELASRAPVLGDDELGELARRFNEMADQMQASHENLEMLVAQRTEEIERLLRERTEFFASISHELRTPLAVILSRAGMMLSPAYAKSARSAEDAARTIKESGEQLLRLVNDILELARTGSGRIEVSLADVGVADVVKDLRRTLEGLASARDLTLKIDVPTSLPPVRADRRRLGEVLVNLIDNAFKYTPPAGEVVVSARTVSAQVAITVRDTGVGLPADEADRIFEPFYRVRGTETQRGEPATGLGLALAKALIEAQEGSIRLEPGDDEGATFVVSLPLAAPAHAQNGARARRGQLERR